jgi:hypothetical protein
MVDIDAKEPDLVSKHRKETLDFQNNDLGETILEQKSRINNQVS